MSPPKSFDLKLKKGSSDSKRFTIRNGGGGILEIHSIKSETDKKKGWLKISKSPCSLSVAHGCKEDVEFSIEAKELPYGYEDKGTITIASNGGDGNVVVHLSVNKRSFPIPAIVVLSLLAVAGIVFGILGLRNRDTKAPTGSISIFKGYSYTNSKYVNLDLSAIDNVGVSGYFISPDSRVPSASDGGWSSINPNISYCETVRFTLSDGDGTKTVYVWYKDAAGNVSDKYADEIVLDTTSPKITITHPSYNDSHTTTNDTINLSGSLSDNISGVQDITCTDSYGANYIANGKESWTISGIKLKPGSNLITVKATDCVGNTSTDTITIHKTNADTRVPEGSVSINQGVSYTRTEEVTLNISATDNSGVVGYYISTNATLPQDTSGIWTEVAVTNTFSKNDVPYDLSRAKHLIEADGNKTIYVWYKDASGNTSMASDSILLDTTAPTITITTPTSNKTNRYVTMDDTVIISGSASDDGSGVNSIRWSNNQGGEGYLGNVTKNWSTGIKLRYNTSRDNEITVIAEDRAGNTSTKGISIVYDTYIKSVPGLRRVIAISVGDGHAIALQSDGTVWAWGSNNYGQLGIGNTDSIREMVQTKDIHDISAIASGNNYNIALKKDGTVWAWGGNNYGGLGDGTNSNGCIPVQVKGIDSVSKIACGSYHTIALKTDGTVWGWGRNSYGQLGDGTIDYNGKKPVQVKGISGVSAIACGESCTVALKTDGTVWAWGYNGEYSLSGVGRLGDGTTKTRKKPVQVKGISSVLAIACGESHIVALKKDGTVWAWGDNDNGQLGDGTIIERSMPVQVKGIDSVSKIACGSNHTIALKTDGTVWAWGNNLYGQLGCKGPYDINLPIKVKGISNISDIAGGDETTVVLKIDGTVWIIEQRY